MHQTDEVKRIFNAANFIRDLGIEMTSFESGRCVTRLRIEDRHLQQDGFVHAGVQATMADHTAGGAAGTMVKAGEYLLSVELNISYLRAAKGESLECIATVLKPGSRFYVIEAEVWCIAGEVRKMTSKAKVTIAVMNKG